MLTPYEVIVKTILPAIRGLLVKELHDKYMYKQIKISESLYITQAAVSYYLTDSRGRYLDIVSRYDDVMDMIKRLAENVHRRRYSLEELTLEIHNIIVYMMDKKYICDLHKILEPHINIDECNLCIKISKGLKT